ncbi:MAG: MoaD/ThiS family protein [Desulfobacula sp.]|jgi:molybdopterin converting factor small subunit
MIRIDLRLFVTLSGYLPENNERLEIHENTTVEKLISDLGIPDDLVKLIFVNGKRQDRAYKLKHGDRVGLFPPVGGG